LITEARRMSYECIVLAKQVVDARNITGEAMTPEGTVNRSALPSIFNPEDLNALEMALRVRNERGGKVTVVTMGPPQATQLLREALYMGADRVILLSDAAFAVSDTLATSYALARALDKLRPFHLVFCGRQAMDGDTAQVGPQVAEKISVPQATYVEELLELGDSTVQVRKDTEDGYEVLRLPLPALLTVTATAATARPYSAKRLMKYKRASSQLELFYSMLAANPSMSRDDAGERAAEEARKLEAKGLLIPTWTPAEIDAAPDRIGRRGSPTQVMKVDWVVLKCDITRNIEPAEDAVRKLVRDLIDKHILS